MTRKPKHVHVGMMTLADLAKITRHVCAWEGCQEGCEFTAELPKTWRWLAVWWGPVAAPPWAQGNIEDRDAVLCPKHAAELDGLLKDIGQHLRKTEGSA